MKADGSHEYNPNIGKGTNTNTEGTPFSFGSPTMLMMLHSYF
jgi:hypothetical protein